MLSPVGFSGTIYGILPDQSMEFAGSIYRICIIYLWDLQDLSTVFAESIYGICRMYLQNMQELYMIFAGPMYRIWRTYLLYFWSTFIVAYHSASKVAWQLVPGWLCGAERAVDAGTEVVHQAVTVQEALAAQERLLLRLQANLHNIQRGHWNRNVHHIYF